MADKKSWLIVLKLALFTLLLGLTARPAHAIPGYAGLGTPRGYGDVQAQLVGYSGGKTTYKFIVRNTQPAGGYGIKGLIVYSRAGIAPCAISDVTRASETLWQSTGRYSWWDFNGGPDSNRNGLADDYIEPGETKGGEDLTFTLTYRGNVSLASLDYVFGLHVVEPWSCSTCFVAAGGLSIAVRVCAAPPCVRSGVGPVAFQYQVTNSGTRALKNITLTDAFGTLTYASQLAAGATATLTRTTTITNVATSLANGIAVTALDALTSVSVSASATSAISVTHPALSIVKTASAGSVLAGGTVTYQYVVKNTGDVAINNIQVTDNQLGSIGAPFNLAAGATAPTLSKSTTLTGTTTNTATAQGKDACAAAAVSSPNSSVTVTVVKPGLSIVKSADRDCVTSGETVTYTYTVRNTGNVVINNLLVTDDRLGVVGILPSLATGATTTFTKTAALTLTTVNTAAASGTDAGLGGQVLVPGNSVTVTVVNPSLTVVESVDDTVVAFGDSVTFTYTVKNTGDVPLTNVTVTSKLIGGPVTSVGTIALLAPGETQPLTRTAGPVTSSLTDTSAVTATGGCGAGQSISGVAPPVTVTLIPAGWTGRVVCGACNEQAGCGIAGARVQVVRVSDGQLIGPPLITGTDGSFTIDPDLANGEYVLRVTAADYYPATTLSQTWATIGADLTTSVSLFALPVTFRSVELAKGQIFFSDRQAWAALEKGSIGGPVVPVGLDASAAVLGQLTDASFNSAGFTRSFRYFGYIPGYPELGLFDASRPVWLMMNSPLVPANGWDVSSANTVSFRNSVYVQDGTQFTGTPQANPSRNSQPYFIRILFSHPFDLTGSDGSARGSAYDYSVWLDLGSNAGITGVPLQTQIEPGVTSLLDGSQFPALATVPWAPGAGASSGLPGVVTAGWMVQAMFQFKQAPGLALTPFFARGAFKNACGETPSTSPFAIHPEVEPSPDL